MSGWYEIRDDMTVQGFLKPESPGVGLVVIREDGDWTFSIDPGERFRFFLTNPAGVINSNRLIECEIEPADDLGGDDAEDPDAIRKYVTSFKDDGITWFRVNGDWVIDTGHDDKTEIHPITSIMVERPLPADNQSRVIDFLVFSDDSANITVHVFHSYEDRTGKFEIPVPIGTKLDGRIAVHLDMSKSKDFSITPDPSGHFATFKGVVHSGITSDGKGFFSATITLPGFTLLTYLLSRGINPERGVLRVMRRANVKKVSELFKRYDTAGFQLD